MNVNEQDKLYILLLAYALITYTGLISASNNVSCGTGFTHVKYFLHLQISKIIYYYTQIISVKTIYNSFVRTNINMIQHKHMQHIWYFETFYNNLSCRIIFTVPVRKTYECISVSVS